MTNKIPMKAFIILFLLLIPMATSIHLAEQGAYVTIVLFSQTPDPVLPGQYVELRFKIENRGSDTIHDFEIELVPEFPFSLDPNEPALKEYGKIPGKINNDDAILANWKVRVDEDAVEGENDIRVRYRFGGETAWIYSDDFDVEVRTIDAIIDMLITTSPDRIAPGQPFTLLITTLNQADSFLQNLKYTLNLGDVFIPIGSTNQKYIRIIKGGESESVDFQLISRGDADKVIYTIPITINFEDSLGIQRLKNASFGLILNEEPNLVTNIEETEIVTKKGKGKITLSVSNVGVDEVKFVTLILKDTEDYRVLSTRNVYLGNIDSDDFETASFDLAAKTRKKSLPIIAALIYKDELNNEFEKNVSLSLPLYSSTEAKRLGLVERGNPLSGYVGFALFVLAVVFWLFMLTDLMNTKMVRYKKLIWLILLILTTIFGAIVYYILIKRRQ